MKNRKILFLDRDGVISKKPTKGDYIKKWSEFEFLPRAIEAIKLLNKKGYEIYIVTNQAGIGRGLMTKDDLKDIHEKMIKKLKKNKAKINGIYYCPHEIKDNCECRKPKPGMFLRAAKEHNFDFKKAIFISDEERDLLAGKAVRCKTILIDRKNNFYKIAQKI